MRMMSTAGIPIDTQFWGSSSSLPPSLPRFSAMRSDKVHNDGGRYGNGFHDDITGALEEGRTENLFINSSKVARSRGKYAEVFSFEDKQ